MRFIANGETYTIDPQRLMFAEARAIEKATGVTFKDFGRALQSGSMEATQAFVWIAVRRVHPEIKFSDLDTWVIADVAQDDEPEEAVDPTPAA